MASPVLQPNRNMLQPDTVAMGKDQESQESWLEKRGIDPGSRIRLKKLSHVRYQHPNLDEIHQFLLDFGLQVAQKTDQEVWYSGYGPDAYVYYARKGPRKFLGGVFEAESREDFDRAGAVEELKHAPGGGLLLTLTDPEGFPFNLIYGQQEVTAKQDLFFDKVLLNFPDDKPRVRQFNRFQPGPAAVYKLKLGHYGMSTQMFDSQLHFYTSTFNINPTDFVYMDQNGERVPVTVFMHLDLGETSVDHHSLFLSLNPTWAHVHHCSFEVHDFDAQQLGHQWLAQKGYRPAWGVGRHVLGSQIFDYWWDVSGNMIEHYADGDLVNRDTPVGFVEAGEDTLAVWGPKVPAEFVE
ncbi:hypothetical protein AnigIFM56816_000702 [Aspergillus niger]|nr:hypothetical protein AnigIFM56816_000702 [Aspergillus niger]